jgi:hypothetical protein
VREKIPFSTIGEKQVYGLEEIMKQQKAEVRFEVEMSQRIFLKGETPPKPSFKHDINKYSLVCKTVDLKTLEIKRSDFLQVFGKSVPDERHNVIESMAD